MPTPVTPRPIPPYTGDPIAAGIAPEVVKAASDVVEKAAREGRTIHRVTLLPGDGIGFEISNATIKILAGAGAAISWDYALVGAAAIAATGDALPPQTIKQIEETELALKGPTGTPSGTGKAGEGGHVSANVRLRQTFDTYQCIRPAKTIAGVPSRFKDVDVVIFRENTEGLYAGKTMELRPGEVVGLDLVTEKGCRRIVEAAFEYARARGRHKVTCVHKANILKLTEGMMLSVFRETAKKYPDIKPDEQIVDSFCMNSVIDPTQFDVIVTNNLFGDIISDLYAGIIGSLGVMPGSNKGPKVSIYEATHGTADKIVGQDKANPTAMLLSATQMLRDHGEPIIADRIQRAVLTVLADPARRTGDLGGTAKSSEFIAHVIAEIERLAVETA